MASLETRQQLVNCLYNSECTGFVNATVPCDNLGGSALYNCLCGPGSDFNSAAAECFQCIESTKNETLINQFSNFLDYCHTQPNPSVAPSPTSVTVAGDCYKGPSCSDLGIKLSYCLITPAATADTNNALRGCYCSENGFDSAVQECYACLQSQSNTTEMSSLNPLLGLCAR